MKNILFIFIIGSIISFISCQENSSSVGDASSDNDVLKASYKTSDEHASDVSTDLVKANNDFAGRIFKVMSAGEPGKNMMISPLSISIAFSMVMNGASGDNLTEMMDVLGFDKMELASVNQQFYEIISSLESVDQDLILSIANSVWISDLFETRVNESFLTALKNCFDASPNVLDFSDTASVDAINSWVSEKTNGKIDKIIDKIEPETVMYLINAIFFKGAWTTTFDSGSTYDGTFTLTNGGTKTVEFMTFKNDQQFKFFSSDDGEGNGYSAVRLSYGRDKVAFYGFIPASGTLDDFINTMVESGIDKFFSNLDLTDIQVVLPKFKFQYEQGLIDIMKSLGMTKLFSTGGLLNLAQDGQKLLVTEAKHKTFIEVNEQGTEAAAVTVIGIGETCVQLRKFDATKPFLFIIRDDRSGTILFIGKVEDPSLTD